EMLPQPFDIREQMRRRIAGEIEIRLAGMRPAPAGAALVEKDDPIARGIEVPLHAVAAAGTRPAMENEGGLADRISTCLPIDPMPPADIEHAGIMRFNLRVKASHDALSGRPLPRSTGA